MLDKDKILKKKTVLLIDDVELFLQLEEGFFKRQNCETTTARSGEEALKIIAGNKPDLIFLDLYMPGIKGDELCKMLKSNPEYKNIPVIIISKSSKIEDIETCLKSGCDYYMVKPIKQTDLMNKAAELLQINIRRHARIFVRIEIHGKNKSEFFFGKTENISLSGIFVICDKNLELNSQVSLKIFLPVKTGEEIKAEGIIAREDRSRNFGYGIKFTEISDDNQKKIEAYINAHQSPDNK
ncbi:MAG TPA: response regulator [bacterium]